MPYSLAPRSTVPHAHTRLACHCSHSHSHSHSHPTPASLRIAFACGDTGGHVYSAIALADELHAAFPLSRSLFLGSPPPSLEASAVVAAGYSFHHLPPPPAHPLLFPLYLARSLLASSLALRRFRPHLLVATGGAPSFPACLAALLLGVAFVIQEQDAAPAPATRLLAPHACRLFVAFNGCVRRLPKRKCSVYGNPVRMALLRREVSKAEAVAHFFPRAAAEWEEGAQVVLVLGGSAGSPEINVAVLNVYYEMLRQRKDRYIIWQTGADGFCEMESLVRSHRRLLLTPFLREMDMAYAAADIVVSRAGAMTCTEILATGKPAILDLRTETLIGAGHRRNGSDGLYLLDCFCFLARDPSSLPPPISTLCLASASFP